MIFVCPSGHRSLSDDYCEYCGARNHNAVQDAVQVSMADGGAARNGELCPTCATPREDGDRYCTNCAYDFETGETLHPADSGPPAGDAVLVVVLSVDGQRPNDPGCPEPPRDRTEHVFALDHRSLTIGRADSQDLQIAIVGDPYVSRRHAEILELGGEWGVRDLGSTNGTKLNGTPLVGAEIKPLRAGDVIELGCFSKLTVRVLTHIQASRSGGGPAQRGHDPGREPGRQ